MALAKTQNAHYSSAGSSVRTLCMLQADMKRQGNLFEHLCSMENILLAYQNAKKGKNHYREVKEIEKNPDKHLFDLQQKLIKNEFVNSPYFVFKKNTGHKIREIYRLPFFPDRVVHHCIVQICQPVWTKLLIRDTFSTIPNRGIHDGVKRIQYTLNTRNYPFNLTQYCLKLDIKKFYPSIDHEILKSIISKKIKDKQLLGLMYNIIDSAPGIPIGNYISQWFGNLYLAYFDHFVKEQLKARFYYRYCDDLVLISDNKQTLWNWLAQINTYLNIQLNLQVKSNYQVFPVDTRGIDFLGYRFFHNYTLVRKTIVQAFKKKVGKEKATKQTQSAYWGWFKHANTYNLTNKYFQS